MSRGFYIRTADHTQKLRERMIALNVAMAELGLHSNYTRTDEHREAFKQRMKAVDRSTEKNGQWKGNNASYGVIHSWMAKKYGKPQQCESCSTTTAKCFDWANISGKYLRVRTDWKRLCRRCHMKEDGRAETLSRKLRGSAT